jgi:hypothetical protein
MDIHERLRQSEQMKGAMNGWLAGKVKPTVQSLLKIRDFFWDVRWKREAGLRPWVMYR